MAVVVGNSSHKVILLISQANGREIAGKTMEIYDKIANSLATEYQKYN
jgi:hypothetical protein